MSDGALAGIRVIEVGNFMSAPFCTLQLADLGADVIKIENPDCGDQVRTSAPFLEGESSSFIRLNRNKRSLALDLKAPGGKEVFRKLIRSADVLAENLRPGTMRDLGLDWPRLAEENPRLVYVAASGWGQDGPYSQRPGLDIMAQGMCGLMSITGEEGGRAPVKVGVPLTDLTFAYSKQAYRWRFGKRADTSRPVRCQVRSARPTRPGRLTKHCERAMGSSPLARPLAQPGSPSAACSAWLSSKTIRASTRITCATKTDAS